MFQPSEQVSAATQINVVLNWVEELKQSPRASKFLPSMLVTAVTLLPIGQREHVQGLTTLRDLDLRRDRGRYIARAAAA